MYKHSLTVLWHGKCRRGSYDETIGKRKAPARAANTYVSFCEWWPVLLLFGQVCSAEKCACELWKESMALLARPRWKNNGRRNYGPAPVRVLVAIMSHWVSRRCGASDMLIWVGERRRSTSCGAARNYFCFSSGLERCTCGHSLLQRLASSATGRLREVVECHQKKKKKKFCGSMVALKE